MKGNRKQHFIPQCYLRMFSDDKKHLWTFDKHSEKSYNASISDICTKNDFYTVSEDYMRKERLDTNLIIEKCFFAEIYEPTYSRWLNKVNNLCRDAITTSNCRVPLADSDKVEFASLITVQWLRHPLIRKENEEFFRDIMPKAVRLFKFGLAKETGNTQIASLDIEAEISDNAIYHAQSTFMNDELVQNFASRLGNNIWTFSYNANGDFFTSDFPIVVLPHVQNVRCICQGLAQYGAELSFPISKNCMLTIWDKNYFSTKAEEDCRISNATSQEVLRRNILRYMYAQRQLFSHADNYEHFQYVHKLIPVTCTPF